MKSNRITTSILASLLFAIAGYGYIAFFLKLDIPPLPYSTIILDQSGEEIGEIIYSGSIRHRQTSFENIPEFYLQSLINLEDRSFYSNNGISLRGITRSFWHNIQAGQKVEGASTLSAQLIRNILGVNGERTLMRKLKESLLSIRLNHLYSKNEILTMYADRISFGYMNYGVVSAAKYYFSKEAKNLTKSEQIALLAIPKNPKKYDPYTNQKTFNERYKMIARTLEKNGVISSEESESILREKLIFNSDHTNRLPYVSDYISKSIKSGDSSLRTNFDLNLTNTIEHIAINTLSELAWRNVSDYGVLIAERTESGPKLRVMIGGAGYHLANAGQVNSTLALRQPGSTIKPFTYALAFRDLNLSPDSTILDLPVQYKTAENYPYEPKNYSKDYKGEVTLAEALSQSINIPAIKLAEKIGVKNLLYFLQSLSITSLKQDADHYGLALTLGDGEVSLFELLQAYTIFSNQGQLCVFRIKEEDIGSCKPIIDSKYTQMIESILTDRYAKLRGFPIGSPLDFPDRQVFVKTGTSRNFRDNWAIGYTDHYMIGVWTGNKNAENMKGVSGATGAGELFSHIVYTLEPDENKQEPKDRETKALPFLEITSPLPGSVYEVDSGKISSSQTIKARFQSNIPFDTSAWLIDDKTLSGSFIEPTIGSHTIEILLIKDGEIVGKSKSNFEVNGQK